MPLQTDGLWKEDWDKARKALEAWWRGEGLALYVTAPKSEPWEPVPKPGSEVELETRWLDPKYRLQSELSRMSRTFFGGVAAPVFDTDVGPGSLGLFLGCEGVLGETTVWYEPVIDNPDSHPPLRFDLENLWWKRHQAIIDAGVREAKGRYLVGMPDLIENFDTLVQLRKPEEVLIDLVERPNWVHEKLHEINASFFECFDVLWDRLRDPWGGNFFCAFQIWGPGKTAKVQCDLALTIGPSMFREFVVPPLKEQCEWLDFSMFHLDGTGSIPHLPALFELECLHAIEWTPEPGQPTGGSPYWYEFYRRIRRAGKSVQAVGILPEEVEPLIDAVGPEGLFIMTATSTEEEARDLLRRVGWD